MIVLYWIAGVILILGGLLVLIASKAGLFFIAFGAFLIFLAIRSKKQKKVGNKSEPTQVTPTSKQPAKKYQGRYLRVRINGINHRTDNAESLCDGHCEYKGVGELVPDPDNKYDPDAIKICCEGKHLGYVPKDRIESVQRVMDKVKEVKIEIEHVERDDESFYVGDAYIFY